MTNLMLPVSFADLLQLVAQLTPEQKRLLRRKIDESPSAPDDYYSLERVQQRIYERARRWWREHGDPAQAAMTDAELDEQFWLFDQDGVPRLKSEQGQFDAAPPPGSLAALAAAAQRFGFESSEPDIATRSREILDTEFAEHLLRYLRDQDASTDSGR